MDKVTGKETVEKETAGKELTVKTIKLYEESGNLFEFDANVIGCLKNGDEEYDIVLDRSAFFPGGGGQMHDTGNINDGNFDIKVSYVYMKDGVIYHRTCAPVAEGAGVRCGIDKEKRFRRMQNHSGEHIVSGLAYSIYGCNNVGFHMSENEAGFVEFITADFDGELNADQLRRLEAEANRAVFSNFKFECFYPSPEELETMSFRSKKEIKEALRLVRAGDVDLCACCAPHVSASGEIGIIKITDFMRYKGGVRVTVCCGFSALEDYCSRQTAVEEISRMLSVKRTDIAAGVSRLSSEMESEKHRSRELCNSLCECIESSFDIERYAVFEPLLDAQSRRNLVLRLAEKRGGIAFVFSGDDGSGYDYAAAVPEKNADDYSLRSIARDISASLGGSGGGSTVLICGRVLSDCISIQKYISAKFG